MPDLPPVSEDFSADSSGYLRALQEMIDMTERLAGEIDEVMGEIDRLAQKIRDLPDTKVVNVIYRISTVGTPPAGGDIIQSAKIVETATGGGTIENVTVGGSSDQIVKDTQALYEEAKAAREAAARQGELAATTQAARAATAAQIRETRNAAMALEEEYYNLKAIDGAYDKLAAQTGDYAGQLAQEAAYEQRLVEESALAVGAMEDQANADKAAAAAGREQAAALREQEMWAMRYAQAADEMRQELAAIDAAEQKNSYNIAAATVQMMEETYQIGRIEEAMQPAGLAMLAMAAAAKDAGGGIGKLAIPLGAAAFGAGGAAIAFGLTAGAIHLIVMGAFELLAVVIPSLYALAAAAAVLLQGMQLVQRQITSTYTAAEALGPMFGKTAGDILGLGHSLQTAQDMANPIAYQILGEALIGLQGSFAKVNSQGLSPFGQLGLSTAHMLSQFFARAVVDVRDSMDKINSVLASAQSDLRAFGEILGNIGHALLNLAAAMPGAAELVLHLIAGFTGLIRIISGLPAPLLTAVFVIEELYRWSGVLVGIFGILGRAIAAVGTLGLPIFARIGLNFGAMVANVISGIGGMVANFVVMGEKIGIFGAKVDAVGGKMVDSLAGAATFMSGPWGAAIAVGAVALGILFFAMSRMTSATQDFVSNINKMVSGASNLTVLNTISQGMLDTVGKTSQEVQHLNQVIAQGPGSNTKGAWEDYGSSVYAAGVPVQQLTSEQRKLFDQSASVVQGASTISKAYGFDFASALGIADLAGVKLANTQVVLGAKANQAGIQIEGLVVGFQKMDLSGTTLTNSMNAINIQAGIQASKVSQVNQAWDQFIGMATSLTGSVTQFNLDLQQMGNQATTAGSKIRAFTGNTQLSVDQIAHALTSFKGTSAQVWQSFNQSVSQANTFMDQMRIAAAAGVVPQQQFTQAIASVIQQLLPYAKYSSAALAEVDALAQEIGGPATTNFGTLKSWIDRNSVSSDKFSGMIDTLTQKLSNVTQVARNFAGTLQTDVLNAIAQASVGTSNITGLTQKYTQALQSNSVTSPIVKQAQDALTQALKNYGFTNLEIQQVEAELSSAYEHNKGAAGDAKGATDAVGGSMLTAKGRASRLKDEILFSLDPALRGIPSPNIKLTESASGTFTLGGMVLTGQQALAIAQMTATAGKHGHAAGGIIPGYAPGQDVVPAMLSPGEGILTPQAVRMIGADTVHGLNSAAKRFADGGIVGLASQSTTDNRAFSGMFNAVMNNTLGGILSGVKSGVAALEKSLQGMGFGIPVTGTPANLMPFFARAIALTGVPMNWMFALETIARYESGFNVNAINLSDINAQRGDPSRGLMQVIMGTFDAYHQPGTSWNIYDPVANIAAAIRYIEARYGSVFNVPGIISLGKGGGYVGYDSGGLLMPGLTMAYNGTGRPEIVSPSGAGDGHIIHNVVNLDGKTIWENQQQYTLRYSLRNSGAAKGIWSPL